MGAASIEGGASAQVVREEIREFHEQLGIWLADGYEAAVQRLESALARQLCFVGLDGRTLGFDELVAALAAAGGSRPGLRIVVDDVVVRELGPGLWLAMFVEHQTPGRDRRTSAILRSDPGAPLGLAWVHVHETPLG